MFDPVNFTKTAKPADIKRWRESELLHGRVVRARKEGRGLTCMHAHACARARPF